MRQNRSAAPPPADPADSDFAALAGHIRGWAAELGFQQVGIADCELGAGRDPADGMAGARLAWRHGLYGARMARAAPVPAELVPGTLRVISVRMNYFPPDARDSWEVIDDGARPTSPATHSGAITTRCCAAGCRNCCGAH